MGEHSQENNGNQLILGDENLKNSISFQQAQAFYNEITGKSERVIEKFNSSFIITIEDITSLHERITQLTVQYNVKVANAVFSVVYVDDSSERFSSLDRFKLHVGNKGVAVEEVHVNYSLLIVLPNTKKPQEYKINIRLISRVAKIEEIKKTMKGLPFHLPLWNFDERVTCRVSVNYIDFAVAHSFVSVVKQWNDSRKKTSTHPTIKIVRPIAKYFPFICTYGLLLCGSYLSYIGIDVFFENMTKSSTAKFVLISLLLNFILYRLGLFLGENLKRNIYNVYELSFINFSGADENFVEEARTAIKWHLIKSLLLFISTLFTGVLASWISSKFFS